MILSGAWLFPLDAAFMSLDLVFPETVGIELSLKDRFFLFPIPSPKTITPDTRAGLLKVSDLIRRGQDSNLHSSDHEPDELTITLPRFFPFSFFHYSHLPWLLGRDRTSA